MIYSIRGKMLHKTENFVVVDCGGVGYRCFTTPQVISKLGAVGNEVQLFTHMNIKEGLIEIYGFSDPQELFCFKMLIGVSGVGAKFAISILSAITPDEVVFNIESSNAKAFTIAHGVGSKLAQRIVLELKGKFKVLEVGQEVLGSINRNGSKKLEAISALEVLGYSSSEATMALIGCDETKELESIVRQGLMMLSKRNGRSER